MSLLDTDHLDGLWTRLAERLVTMIAYGMDETAILFRLKGEGYAAQDAWFALAAAKVEIAYPTLDLADAIYRDYAERDVTQLFSMLGGMK